MTLKRFLDCAYALFVEMFQSIPGTNLLVAMEQVNEIVFGATASGNGGGQNKPPNARDNDRALAEFQQMMGGLNIA